MSWLASRQWRRVHVQADDSAHGQALCVAICEALVRAGLQRVEEPEHADVEVFAGRLKPSREHWQARRQAGSNRPLVLTDDAASPYLGCAEDQRGKTFVIGFGTPDNPGNGCHASTLHQTFFAAEPHTYFRESLLMLYVLAELANGGLCAGQLLDALQHTTFNTPLGAVGFDRGELRGAMTCVWTPGPTGLTPVSR
ncbi:Receptor family ligand binding protein [Pseudomonas amygdali pv. lachrymans]|uniref:Receptor family ligand binding protein n=1 Tax=Pseudomonas amygdali pv. lachrymans TaxID=53707 RepID=A0AB37RAB1_PSEAV|nr:Receptor family ligand binding protein [Pseudomonas amygdali pv. lachrymans]RMU22427.1 Receptor family ligand binding protein [Pseudomonas amygdali pv. lachrymans]